MAVFAWVKSRTLFTKLVRLNLESMNVEHYSEEPSTGLIDPPNNSNNKLLETISQGGIWLS
tara:strand:+ start:140 stop:322 length:183 start_codon:yes stop_codon:yes gene_type:complete